MATLAASGASASTRTGADVTDHALVQAVRAGDDRAFERLYDRYHRRISAYIFGMVHDHGRAEDLTQEVFMSALRRMRQTDRPIAFKPWIYEIAKNACIDAFRRSRRAEEVSYDAEEGLGASDYGRLVMTGPTPDVAIDTKQKLDHLCGAFGGLSEAHHQILVMRELEGLSYREIGERLGMSRPSVESTLFRARRRLTEEYEELVTGERCLRIQAIIAGAGESALGTRDQRRVGRHISYCQPCRRQARLAGLDAAVMARPVRAKIAAFLPLPAFLRRRWLPSEHGPSASHSAAQWSMTASQLGEPGLASWLKVAAIAGTVAVAGASAGAVQQHHEHARAASAPRVVRAAPAAATSATAAPVATHHGARATASRTGSSHGGAHAGRRGVRSSTGTTSTEHGTSTRSTSPGTTAGSGTAAGGTTATGAAGTVTQSGGSTLSSVQQTLTDATSTSGSQPLASPDPSQLLNQGSTAADAPSTVGGTVTTVTDAAGSTVGGSAGSAVQSAGQTAGSTADGLLGGK